MPTYHFTLKDRVVRLDPRGTDLPDTRAAQREAVLYAAEHIKHRPDEIISDGHLEVTVSDNSGLDLFMVTVITTNAAASGVS